MKPFGSDLLTSKPSLSLFFFVLFWRILTRKALIIGLPLLQLHWFPPLIVSFCYPHGSYNHHSTSRKSTSPVRADRSSDATPFTRPTIFSFASISDVDSGSDSLTITTASDEDDNTIMSLLGKEKWEEIQQLIDQRSKARWVGDYTLADIIRDQIQNLTIQPDNYEISIQDIPRKDGGGSSWTIEPTQPSSQHPPTIDGPTVLQLAHTALGLAIESSIQYNLRRAAAATSASSSSLGREQKEQRYYGDDSFYQQQLDTIVQQVKDRIRNNPATFSSSSSSSYNELAGRKAADAAFWFAIAGVADQELFSILIQRTIQELKRFGERSSCRPKDIYQIMERFAASGCSTSHIADTDDDDSDTVTFQNRCIELEETAGRLLKYKETKNTNLQQQQDTTKDNDEDDNDDTSGLLDLHSDRSLLLLWKFSTKQKKQKAFLQSAHKHWEREQQKQNHLQQQQSQDSNKENLNTKNNALPQQLSNDNETRIVEESSPEQYDWNNVFKDPSRPLVIDIGCGMGVSLLGLAKASVLQQEKGTAHEPSSDVLLLDKGIQWSDCNFAGVDLGRLGIGYANGVAQRIGLNDRLHFFVDSAEDFLNAVQTYDGPIVLSLVQFPTPFRLKKDTTANNTGNKQLPDSAEDGNFMVSKNLLQAIQKVLSSSKQQPLGQLLIQSNCEDVAVWMRNMACHRCEFDYVTLPHDLLLQLEQATKATTTGKARQPQRTRDWIEMGGERASGSGWLRHAILPRSASTETEVACTLNGTPVHRCLLKPTRR